MDKAAVLALWQELAWWKKALVGAFFVVLVGVGWWYFVIDPQMAEIAQLQQQAVALD